MSQEAGFTRFTSEYEMGWAKPEFTLRKLDTMWNEALLLRTVSELNLTFPEDHFRSYFQFEYTMKSITWTQIYFRIPAVCACMYARSPGIMKSGWVHLLLKKRGGGGNKQPHKKKPTLYWNQTTEILAQHQIPVLFSLTNSLEMTVFSKRSPFYAP